MKNILNHNGTSQLLLANVDDGTNRIIINGEELDSTYWVGENSYVILIDGTPIGIKQISSDSGNIMLQKVPDSVNEYRLVRQSDALCYSHIGQIIESTTLATLEDVQAIYGSDTTWIQHTGYILRGASSGVTENSAVKDGGEDTHTLIINEMPSHTHIQDSHNHGSIFYNSSMKIQVYADYNGTGSGNNRILPAGFSPNVATPLSTRDETATNQNTGGGAAHNNMQCYKNVYIWERTS